MMALLFVAAMVAAVLMDTRLIAFFKQREMHQAIREDGPQAHLKKGKTPSMGGAAFLAVFAAAALLWARDSGAWWVVLVSLVGGGIGLWDDWLKVSGRDRRGVKARLKIAVITVVSVLFGIHLLATGGGAQTLPFGLATWHMGWLVVPFAVVVVNGTANAVNLTDGLDGLLGGLMLVVLAALFALHGFGAMALPHGWMLPAVAGAVGGFLLLNVHPARQFMGDTGSLFLGTFLAAYCLKAGLAWFLPVLGLVFVAEALSVVVQVISFRVWGKRVFRMSPLHHHFELSGLHESQVVIGFWLTGLITALVVLAWG